MNLGIISIEPSAVAAGIIAMGIALAGFAVSRQVVIEGRRIRRGIEAIRAGKTAENIPANIPADDEIPPTQDRPQSPPPVSDGGNIHVGGRARTPKEPPIVPPPDPRFPPKHAAVEPSDDDTALLPAIEDRQERTAYSHRQATTSLRNRPSTTHMINHLSLLDAQRSDEQ